MYRQRQQWKIYKTISFYIIRIYPLPTHYSRNYPLTCIGSMRFAGISGAAGVCENVWPHIEFELLSFCSYVISSIIIMQTRLRLETLILKCLRVAVLFPTTIFFELEFVRSTLHFPHLTLHTKSSDWLFLCLYPLSNMAGT